jgi:hypothetical protein
MATISIFYIVDSDVFNSTIQNKLVEWFPRPYRLCEEARPVPICGNFLSSLIPFSFLCKMA